MGLWKKNFASFRSHVLLPQTGDSGLLVIQSEGTETGTAEDKRRQRREEHPVVFFYVLHGTGSEGGEEEDECCQLQPANGEAEPST